MTGIKRDIHGNSRAAGAAAATPAGSRIRAMFETFRDELDEHHDRRERIVKASRDVTAQSKKIIFALQRVRQSNRDFPPQTQKDLDARLASVSALLSSLAPDLQTVNRHRYVFPLRCLEELVEALSFAHYLRHQTLLTPSAAQQTLPAGVTLLPHDYMYGLFDLFGEMMRFATVATAQTGRLVGGESRAGVGRNILSDMQELGCAFEMLPEVPTKEYRIKMETMRQSVRKVERLGYGLVVRGSERPKGWLPDMKEEAAEPPSPT